MTISPAKTASSGGSTGEPGAAERVGRDLAAHLRAYGARVRGGDMGSLPAVLGLIVLCAVFGALRPAFLTAGNFANLFTQGAVITTIAMGLVFVLLLGEIDLSAGFVSGVAGAVLAVTLTQHGWPLTAALAAALGTGAVIGLVLGTLVARVGIPSFVVTLGGFLAFQGVVLIIIGQGGNIPVTNEAVLAIQNKNLAPALGWVLFALVAGGYAATKALTARSRRRKGLESEPFAVAAAKVAGVVVIAASAVAVLNQERSRNILVVSLKGVPIVVPVLLALLALWTFVLGYTRYGLHIYAVGGNAEAARRAGIKVARIRTSVFVIGSTMAALAGVFAASRANSVDPNAGGSNTLLYAVGAAVIGGTSLFGGRGRIIDAVIGGAVVAVIDNGMGLLGYSSGVKFVVTGLVLVVAAGVDALSRRRSAATGL
ncbi:sugar ABC transporter permease [Peterkaempfera bronchialis]|uniref:Xylose transport system permease protein XylH n=1 Tax=Peterkaempfera bronchialis TaxID=2126346 RepID=A0A345SUD9_9ACTN|nr:ABC transporter permease [Peterkaempfera bronchialis]AXI77344.1 ABC transporter permease [Peterkaempfera bronchialis]